MHLLMGGGQDAKEQPDSARCFTCQDFGLILNLILILGYGTARCPNQNDTYLG